MIRLLVVEVRRAFARRLVRVLVAVALLGIIVIGIGAYSSSDPQSGQPFDAGDIWSGEEGEDSEDGNTLGQTTFPFLLMAMLGGASMVGAEYKAGTLTPLLTWEPRRGRVIAAKLLAPAFVAGLLYALLQGVLLAVLLLVAETAGSTEGIDGDFAALVRGLLLRGSLLTAGCAALGGAVAFLGRNTSAALGAVLGYFVIVERILQGLRPNWDRWFVAQNLFIVLSGHTESGFNFDRGVPAAAVLLLAYLAVVCVAAGFLFARRDVA